MNSAGEAPLQLWLAAVFIQTKSEVSELRQWLSSCTKRSSAEVAHERQDLRQVLHRSNAVGPVLCVVGIREMRIHAKRSSAGITSPHIVERVANEQDLQGRDLPLLLLPE